MNAMLNCTTLFLSQKSAFITLNETISNIFEVGTAEERKSNFNYYDMLVVECIKSTCP